MDIQTGWWFMWLTPPLKNDGVRQLGFYCNSYPLVIADMAIEYYHLVMTNIAMERFTIFKNGKPSISMGHLYHGYVK